MSAHRCPSLVLVLLIACSEPTAPSEPAAPDIAPAMAAMQAAGLTENPGFAALQLYAMTDSGELP